MRISFTLLLIPALAAAGPITQILSRSAPVQSETILLRSLTPRAQYSLLYSLSSLQLPPAARVDLEIRQGADLIASKSLHAGDADYYTQFRVPRAGNATLTVKAANAAGKYLIQVNRWPLSPTVKSVPNHRWQDAQAIPLGKTVFASGDDAEYIPLPGANRKTARRGARRPRLVQARLHVRPSPSWSTSRWT